jgi:hypothetical protein
MVSRGSSIFTPHSKGCQDFKAMGEVNFVKLPDPCDDGQPEPTDGRVSEYLEWLDGNVKKDQDLKRISRDALRAPIPPGWKLYEPQGGTGEPFYFNVNIGQSLFDHPQDRHFKDQRSVRST